VLDRRSVDLLGDWGRASSPEAFLGVRRFDDMQRSLGIAATSSPNGSSAWSTRACSTGFSYQEKPDRYEYVLTEKGRDFYPVLAAMITWETGGWPGRGRDRAPPHPLRHDMTAHVVCSECGEPIRAKDVRARLGPGYPADQPPPGGSGRRRRRGAGR